MKLLITGGAGYIGYSLVEHLMRSNQCITEVVIYDSLMRNNYAFFNHAKFSHKPISFIQGELLDSRRLASALKGVEVVMHLAAKVTTPYADLDAHFFDQNNHWGTAALVDAIEEVKTVSHFIYMSSMSVYGSDVEPANEIKKPHPESFYGISKLNGEKHVERLMDKMNVQILRAANVYGYNPCMRIDAVVNRFMFEANFQKLIQINGTGEQRRTFIHVDKLASVMDSLICLEVPSGIYNVAEHNKSIQEVIDDIETLYPDLEKLYITKNMAMKQVVAHIPCKIFNHVPLPKKTFAEELTAFKGSFSF